MPTTARTLRQDANSASIHMHPAYWQQQTIGKPLFPELLWSRPENRGQAGKLLIIGGNAYSFAAVAQAYQAAMEAGIGIAHVLLPDSLRRTVGTSFEAGKFAPSTPSGSFNQKALTEFMMNSSWADGVLLTGDLGRNSETAVILERFISSYPGPLAITKDAADYFTSSPRELLKRPDTGLVVSFAQLQRLTRHTVFPKAFVFDKGLVHFVETLHDFTTQFPINIVVKYLNNLVIGVDGNVCTTRLSEDIDIWRVSVAAYASVWWLQNMAKVFAALSTGVYQYNATLTKSQKD